MRGSRTRSHRAPETLILLLILLALAGLSGVLLSPLVATVRAEETTTPNSPVAPASLILVADTVVVPAGGGTVTLNATVHGPRGRPVAGVPVQFNSTLGSVTPSSTTTGANGSVSALFSAGAKAGQAAVTATAGELSQVAWLQIRATMAGMETATLQLTTAANTLDPGQETLLTATLLDGAGQPLQGEPVTFFGSLGLVSPASAVSDANGRVVAAFKAGGLPGQARISVLSGHASASSHLTIKGKLPDTPTPPPSPDGRSIFLPAVTR
jgi:hypothetical protein